MMELLDLQVAVVTLDICQAVPEVLLIGMTSSCLAVLTAGLLVGCFKALIRIMGGR